MKTFFTFVLLFISTQLYAQVDTLFYTTELNIDITAMGFKSSKDKLIDFIKQNKLIIQNQNENNTSITMQVEVSKSIFEQFDEIIPDLGFVTSRKVNTINNITKVNDIKLEINYLKEKKLSYNQLLNKLDDKSEKYITLWNENQITEEKIFKKEKELLPLIKTTHNYEINIRIYEERTSPENSKVSFVNMPGFEYSYLNIETPKSNVSTKNYQGYLVKYLFTKGKTFAVAGAYKSTASSITDSSLFSELFVFGFGQDFYSRHLGRGERKFLNLYSGYTLGLMLATGINSSSCIFYLSPSIGLELFKNKYMLLDSKVTYLIPLSNYNNLRGFTFNTSLNFVF